jgi:methyl-accepting chemotaxis protein
MLTEVQKKLVQDSWAKVEPIAPTAASLFYAKLFELDPSLKPLFKGDLTEQGAKLMKTLAVAVGSLNKLDGLVPVLQQLGRRHKNYGVLPPHYDTVAVTLLDTLDKGLGDAFTPDVKDAWVAIYGVVSSTMIAAASDDSSDQAAAH